jgi:hypothetical protein
LLANVLTMILEGQLKEPKKFRNYPKVANSTSLGKWRLVDRNNNNEPLTEFKDTKYSKSDISLVQFRLEILRVNSGL